ncbi:MAG: regulatory iron-sulfur-containing complex subunit RicT [Candidatus Margulisiibacteriota bacterium]
MSHLGIKFRKFNNITQLKGYKDDALKVSSAVIVETDRGVEFGWIVSVEKEKGRHAGSDLKLRKVIRYANETDLEKEKEITQKEKETYCAVCAKIREYEAPIKVLQLEYLFDMSRLILFYKLSDQKNIFNIKDISKDLSSLLSTRVEMHQISARDETRLMSGIGPCGRGLCCSTFLQDFPRVTVKMVKEQGIQISQTKTAGICGKLLCCLQYEYEQKDDKEKKDE